MTLNEILTDLRNRNDMLADLYHSGLAEESSNAVLRAKIQENTEFIDILDSYLERTKEALE